ncbi:MAG TPA: protoporphyrinogen oxidase [Candidatus Acidoferrales bacterium]|nr:protoporphyrinogen oxidase [Candidatus Acidoferrales bacterium]
MPATGKFQLPAPAWYFLLMSATQQVIVIGAGITGLACAFRLQQSGIRVLVLEASDSPGGLIATFERNGFLFEAGPQCPRFAPALWGLVRDLELDDEFVPGDSGLPRYLLKNGKLHKAPFSPFAFLATGLVGAGSKYRLLTEALRGSRPPAGEESLAGFVRRKFDDEVLAYVVEPFISAIFAGNTEQIGVASAFPFLARWEREHGSVLRGAIRERKRNTPANSQPASAARNTARNLAVTDALPAMGSFRRGLGTLPQALAQKLGDSIRFRAKVETICGRTAAGGAGSPWRLQLSDGEEIISAGLVVTAPAYEAARLLGKTAPALSAKLSELYYAPMAVVSSGYDRTQVRNSLHGFGLMIPRREKLNTFFNVWNSSVIGGRAPAGKVLLTSFAGGATNPEFVRLEEKAIAQIIEAEMAAVLGINGPSLERLVWKFPKALPQFNVGHAQMAAEIREALTALPGLYLAGNYLEGRSLGDCVEIGSRTAQEAMHQFSTQSI